MYKLILVPIVVIILVIVFQLLDEFNTTLFGVLDNTTNISYVSTIKILIGAIGIIIVLLWIAGLVQDFRSGGMRIVTEE